MRSLKANALFKASRFRAGGVVVMLASWVALGVAAEQPPYGEYTRILNNGHVRVNVYGVPNDDHLVSGTNVKFSVRASFFAVPPPDGGGGAAGGSEPVKKIRILDLKAKIEETLIPNPLPINDSSTEHRFDVWFASTHFPHDRQHAVKAIGTFWIQYTDNSEETVTIDVTVKPRTYNKGGLLATSVDNGGGEATTALASVNAVGPIIEAMNHVVRPQPFSSAQSLDEAALDQVLIDSTVFFACTHGEPGAFWDSASVKLYDRQKVMTVLSHRPAGRPGYNLVFIAGCKTALGTQGDDLAAKFGVHSNSVNRAYVGFKATIFAPEVTSFCTSVFQKLMEGNNIESAIESAYKRHVPSSPGVLPSLITPITPVILGDRKSKLINVYGGPSWYQTSHP